MFGPNPDTGIIGHQDHRGDKFRSLLDDLEMVFRCRFGISKDMNIVFITGSGTLANEVLMRSLGGVDVCGADLMFRKRLDNLNSAISGKTGVSMMVYYETADSYVNPESVFPPDNLRICDMVSAFPYYEPYTSLNAWTTVSCKALGGWPVISIIVYDEKVFEQAISGDSYLSLKCYDEYWKRRETPHTPSMPLYQNLYEKLLMFDLLQFRTKINSRRQQLEDIIPREYVIGSGPVFNFKEGIISKNIIEKWGIYKGKHIFLYSGTDEQFDEFCMDLKQSI